MFVVLFVLFVVGAFVSYGLVFFPSLSAIICDGNQNSVDSYTLGRAVLTGASALALLALLYDNQDICVNNEIHRPPMNTTLPCPKCTSRALYYSMQDPHHDSAVCNTFVYAALGDSCTFAHDFFLLAGLYLLLDGLLTLGLVARHKCTGKY